MFEPHTEFLHIHFDDHGKVLVQWQFASWRKSFVHMYKGNHEQSLPVTVRIIGWKENFQKNSLYGQYLDIVVEEGTNSIAEQSLAEVHEILVEVGLGSGEEFFPILQSERARFNGKQRASNSENAEWSSLHMDNKAWYSQFSTYTYYEKVGGK
jgi:galactose-1-phosphate uridylyltransferase